MRASFPRFLELEAKHHSVIGGLRAGAGRGGIRLRPNGIPPSPFVALPGGMRELTTTLAAALPAAALRCGVGVDEISGTRGEYVLRLSDGSRITAASVIVAIWRRCCRLSASPR